MLTFVEPDGTSFHSLGDTERKRFPHFLCRDQVDEFMMEMAVRGARCIRGRRRVRGDDSAILCGAVGGRLVARSRPPRDEEVEQQRHARQRSTGTTTAGTARSW